MRQTIITHLILIFIFTTIFLCIVFSFYYSTPHNYTLYEFNKKNKKLSSKEFIINSKDQLVLTYSEYEHKLLKITRNEPAINSEENINKGICSIITNSFKSENIIIEPNNLILLNNSDLIIKNNSNINMIIYIEIYSL
jgi:hypothetical protein